MNRFSEQLLCSTQREIDQILFTDTVFDTLYPHMRDNWQAFCESFFTRSNDDDCEYLGYVHTFACLLAAMSDQDIDELVINWKES